MSTLNVSNISDGSTSVGTSYVVNGSAKAWIDWAAQPATVVDDSLNVSSLTDNATGSFDVNYTNNFNSANYSTSGNQAFNTDITTYIYMVQPRNSGTVLAGSCGVYTKYVSSGGGSGISDYYYNSMTAHGDLA